jgi:hypothetical protein
MARSLRLAALSTDQMVVLVRLVQSVSVSDETARRQAWVNQDQHYRVKHTAVIRPPLLQLHGGGRDAIGSSSRDGGAGLTPAGGPD